MEMGRPEIPDSNSSESVESEDSLCLMIDVVENNEELKRLGGSKAHDVDYKTEDKISGTVVENRHR